jgi:3-oxoadipate enol-lactonase
MRRAKVGSKVRRRGLLVAGAAGSGLVAGAGVALANPAVRAEAKRLRRFARPLDVSTGAAPIPPPLPPGRTVVVPGRGELFVRDSGGDGPTALLLHGWGATADANFFNVYAALSDAYRVVAVDHRSHGRGLRPDVEFSLEDCADDAAALLGVLGCERAVVVGYSMGGPIALLLARRHPGRVTGLVLEATSLEFSSAPGERMMWRGLTLVEAVLSHSRGDGVVQRILRETIDKEPSLERYRAWLAGEFRRGHVQGIIEAGQALGRFDAREFAGDLGLPTAAVITTADRLVPPRKQRALAATMEARVFEIAGDHDAPFVDGAVFGGATRSAVDHVADLAGRRDGRDDTIDLVDRPAPKRHRSSAG